MEMKGALTLPRFSTEELFQEQVEIEMERRQELGIKMQKCVKCGALYPESSYDCPNCGYSSGGD